MNQYETMFFNNPEELKKKIKSLVEKQLETREGEKCEELKDISKYIYYSTSISETVSFECDEPYETGDGSWESIEEYLEAKENLDWICSQAEARNKGVIFSSSSEWGTFTFNGDTEVEITNICLNDEGCSKEALDKENEELDKKIVKQKQKKIQELEEQLLKLKAANQ